MFVLLSPPRVPAPMPLATRGQFRSLRQPPPELQSFRESAGFGHMKDEIVFFHVKNPAQHALTKAGYTTIKSHGKIIVYCTDEGPLDPQYRTQWLEWRKQRDAKS